MKGVFIMPNEVYYSNKFSIASNDSDAHLYFKAISPVLDNDAKIIDSVTSDEVHIVMSSQNFRQFIDLIKRLDQQKTQKGDADAATK